MRARPDLIFGHPASKLSPHPLGLAQTLALGRDGKLLSEWTKQVGLPPELSQALQGETVVRCWTAEVRDCHGWKLDRKQERQWGGAMAKSSECQAK